MTAPTKKAAFFMLGMMMIALSFGESITFSGIKVSWLFAAVIFVLTVFHVIISKGSYAKRQKEVKALAFFALFWGVYSLLQGFWAKDTELWNQGIVSTLINIFLVTVLGYFISDERDIDSFLKYSVPLWIINIAFGLYEAITNEHFVKASSESISSAFVRTFFGNPNDSATWLTLCFLMLSYYLKRKNANKLFSASAWVITTFVVIQTDSRACVFGMLAYAAVYISASIIIKSESDTKKGVFKTVFWICAVLIGVITVLGIYGDLIPYLILHLSKGSNQTSDLHRLEILQSTLKVIFDSAFLGVGALQSVSHIGINPHNFFLELFADFGVAVFAFTCYMFYKIVSASFYTGENARTRPYYLSYAITFLIISISSSSMNRLRLTWVSLVVIFLAACYDQKTNDGTLHTKQKNKWIK